MKTNTKYEAVVIGCSAGGLHALSFILSALPPDYSIPVIVVQHRINEQRELLEEVLQEKCFIKIKQADEKEKIRSGFVYIAPPGYHLLIENDRTFSLSSDERILYSRPSIDVLFESAATVYGNKLIGIILTGSNHDGTTGLLMIKRHNGLTIAQSPMEAQYPVMPASAIDNMAVTDVYTLQEIQDFLLKNQEKLKNE